MYVIGVFTIRALGEDGSAIFKSTKTGAVAKLTTVQESQLGHWLSHQHEERPGFVESLMGHSEILVCSDSNEFEDYKNELIDTRDNRARIFSLHIEPTIQCQLECGYCFENGINRGKGMSDEVFQQSLSWIGQYFDTHKEVQVLRTIFFGGEPLLRKDIVKKAVVAYSGLAKSRNLEYMTEIITNGELLTEEVAAILSEHNWKRVQITLDGPREVHDARRNGKNNRPTFDNIWANVLMLARSNYVPGVDIRISLDQGNAGHIPRLLEFMVEAGVQEKIRLSVGFIESSFFVQIQGVKETWQARHALKVWETARDLGFSIPDEYASGPLCVAQAKHSAVLQPDGHLQKCFCTSGQNQHAFGSILDGSTGYTRDPRYENFKRLDDCISEKCPYIPICGGGCTYHAVVENGGTTESFSARHCKKDLLHDLNEGLLRLSY